MIAKLRKHIERSDLDLVGADQRARLLLEFELGEPGLVVLAHGARLGVLRRAKDRYIILLRSTISDGRGVPRGVLLPLDICLFRIDAAVWLRGDTPRFNRLLHC